jgi:uncharacterized protein YuzE
MGARRVKITYDPEYDTTYVELVQNKVVYRTTKQGGCYLDWSKDGKLIGIEYLSKSKMLEYDIDGNLTEIDRDNIPEKSNESELKSLNQEIEKLKYEIHCSLQILEDEQKQREIAESERYIYVKISDAMTKRILNLQEENEELIKQLEEMKKGFN